MVGDRISISQETRAAVILQTHLVIAALDGGGGTRGTVFFPEAQAVNQIRARFTA